MPRPTPARLDEIVKWIESLEPDAHPWTLVAREVLAEVRALTAERDREETRGDRLRKMYEDACVELNEARATVAQQAERLAEVEGQAGAMREALAAMIDEPSEFDMGNSGPYSDSGMICQHCGQTCAGDDPAAIEHDGDCTYVGAKAALSASDPQRGGER